MSKDAYYFSHDTNARTDTKVMAMLCDYKAMGYGCYWAIIEMLSEQDGYKLRLNKLTYNAVAMAMLCDCNTITEFINDCIKEYELFDSDEEYFWSNSLIRRMEIKEEKRAKRAAAGKKGAESRWKSEDLKQKDSNAIANALQTDSNDVAKDSKGKEIKESKEKENIIWDYYICKMKELGKDRKKTENKMKHIRARLNDFTVEQLKMVIDAVFKSDFMKGKNEKHKEYLEIDNFLCNTEKVEKWLNNVIDITHKVDIKKTAAIVNSPPENIKDWVD